MKTKLFVFVSCFLLLVNSLRGAVIRGFQADLGMIMATGRLGANLEHGYSGRLIIKGPKILLPLEVCAGASYQHKKMTEETRLLLCPIFLTGVINFKPMVFLGRTVPYLRFGGGAVYETVHLTYYGASSSWDPGLLFAAGLSMPLSAKVSVLIEFNYMFVYQKHLDRAEHNGNFLSLSLGLGYMFKP